MAVASAVPAGVNRTAGQAASFSGAHLPLRYIPALTAVTAAPLLPLLQWQQVKSFFVDNFLEHAKAEGLEDCCWLHLVKESRCAHRTVAEAGTASLPCRGLPPGSRACAGRRLAAAVRAAVGAALHSNRLVLRHAIFECVLVAGAADVAFGTGMPEPSRCSPRSCRHKHIGKAVCKKADELGAEPLVVSIGRVRACMRASEPFSLWRVLACNSAVSACCWLASSRRSCAANPLGLQHSGCSLPLCAARLVGTSRPPAARLPPSFRTAASGSRPVSP